MPTNGDGFGLDYWGVGPWGILPATGLFEVEGVFAVSERTIRVTLTSAALLGTPFREGAALNLDTWAVAIVGSSEDPLLLAVREVEDSEARQFELYTLNLLPRYPAQLTVSLPGLLSAALAPLTGPSSAQLDGAAKQQVTPRSNSSNPADLRSERIAGALAGTLVTTAGGDYQTESGDALLRKMVLRRLTTSRGAFKHLPNFGLGLRAKQALRGGGINDLRVAIEEEVRREPDVASVSALLSFTPSTSVLEVTLKIRRVSTGQDIELSEQLSMDDGVIL